MPSSELLDPVWQTYNVAKDCLKIARRSVSAYFHRFLTRSKQKRRKERALEMYAALLASAQEIHADLHAQVNTAVAQLLGVTQSVEELNRQNDGLRREIAGLKQQLAKRL